MKRDQSKNGSSLQRSFQHLQEAQANLTQALATLAQNQACFQSELREIERERLEFQRHSEERFRRIEDILELHTRLLQALPEAVREKMGFRPATGQ